MLRSSQYEQFPWEFRTMSRIRDDLLDACTQRLKELPALSIIDPQMTPEKVQALYRVSYTAQEHPLLPAPESAAALMRLVLSDIDEELHLLPPDEYTLLERAVQGLGETAIYSREELPAAESLARRLWLFTTLPDDGTVRLHMHVELVAHFHACFQDPAVTHCHSVMEEFQEQTNYVLMHQGMLPAVQAADMLLAMLSPSFTHREDLCRRTLLCMYDHAFAPDMELMLIHPGLAVPRQMMKWRCTLSPAPYDEITYPFVQFTDADAMTAERMAGLIQLAVRPEKEVRDVVTDLCLLAKQGAGLEDMTRVLASSLIIGPTPDMLECLRELHQVIQPWPIASKGNPPWP